MWDMGRVPNWMVVAVGWVERAWALLGTYEIRSAFEAKKMKTSKQDTRFVGLELRKGVWEGLKVGNHQRAQ